MTSINDDVPLVMQYGKRCILWGCRKEGNMLFASIGFFNRGINTNAISLSDLKRNRILKVETPQDFFKQRQRGRSQNIYLKIIEDLRSDNN